MRKVKLLDGTVIENCTDATTSNAIYAVRSTYGEAAAIRDLFNPENAKTIKVLDENDQVTTVGSNLVLIPGCTVSEDPDGVKVEILTRVKTQLEQMQDEIAELQEAVIEA